MHGLSFTLKSWAIIKLDSVNHVHIKFVPPVSGLLSSVESQTSATCASTSVVFTTVPNAVLFSPPVAFTCFELHTRYRFSWNIWMRSFKIYGMWLVLTYIHTRKHNAVTLVWGLLRLAPISMYSLILTFPDNKTLSLQLTSVLPVTCYATVRWQELWHQWQSDHCLWGCSGVGRQELDSQFHIKQIPGFCCYGNDNSSLPEETMILVWASIGNDTFHSTISRVDPREG